MTTHKRSIIALSARALPPRQVRAMAGLVVASARGLAPAGYIDVATAGGLIAPVPTGPAGFDYLEEVRLRGATAAAAALARAAGLVVLPRRLVREPALPRRRRMRARWPRT